MPPAAFFSSTASVTPFFIQSPRTALVPLIAPMMAILIGSAGLAGCGAVVAADLGAAVGAAAGCGVPHALSSGAVARPAPTTADTLRKRRRDKGLLLILILLQDALWNNRGIRSIPCMRYLRYPWQVPGAA